MPKERARWRKREILFPIATIHAFVIIGPPNYVELQQPPSILEQLQEAAKPILILTLGPCDLALQKRILEEFTGPWKVCVFLCALPVPLTPQAVTRCLEVFEALYQQQIFTPVIDFDHVSFKPKSFSIVKGTNLASGDLDGTSDPFCKFGIGPSLGHWTVGPFRTKTKKSTLDPVWTTADNVTSPLDTEKYRLEHIIIEIWDQDFIGKDSLGHCSIPVTEVNKPGEMVLQVKRSKKEKATGTITINIA